MKFLIDMPVTPDAAPHLRAADLDYPRLIALQHTDRPGVILFRGGAYSDREMLALLDRVLARASGLDPEHSIVVVDRTRIRRRALPIGE